VGVGVGSSFFFLLISHTHAVDHEPVSSPIFAKCLLAFSLVRSGIHFFCVLIPIP
jgi:hypothetical protein